MNAITALQRVWDGTQWVKARGDSSGYCQVDIAKQPVSTKARTYYGKLQVHYVWAVSIPAGGSYTLLDTTSGAGKILYMHLRADGASGTAGASYWQLTVDGVSYTPCTIGNIYAAVGSQVTNFSFMGCLLWDTANHIYEAWICPEIEFTQSLRIELVNADTANAITARSYNIVLWEI